MDQPALLPLPLTVWVFAEWQKAKVGPDYRRRGSRPLVQRRYQLVKEKLDVRITALTVECFLRGRRVASRVRSSRLGGYTTTPEHMPRSHREYLEWTPARLIS